MIYFELLEILIPYHYQIYYNIFYGFVEMKMFHLILKSEWGCVFDFLSQPLSGDTLLEQSAYPKIKTLRNGFNNIPSQIRQLCNFEWVPSQTQLAYTAYVCKLPHRFLFYHTISNNSSLKKGLVLQIARPYFGARLFYRKRHLLKPSV